MRVKKEIHKMELLLNKMKIGLICFMLFAIFLSPASAVSSNTVINPGFESGTSPWAFYTDGAGTFLNDATGAASAHAGHIKISQQGTNVQLYQNNLVLEPNTEYTLTFRAYSNTGHDLTVSLLKHGSPYTNYGLSNKVVNLNTTWGAHSIQFKTAGFSGIVNDARLMFSLAAYDAASDQYYFDDVNLTKVSSVPPPAQLPTITTQPSGKTVEAGQTATFNVVASGTAPLSYQWQKNSVNISGATGAIYTTPVTTSANNGDRFHVVVSNTYGKATSIEAILNVTSTSLNKQIILLDVNYTHNTTLTKVPILRSDGLYATSGKAFSFFNSPPDFPDNLVSPINYANGKLYQRLEVITKPTTKTVRYQICIFQDQIIAAKHACSPNNAMSFTRPGTYYTNQSMTSLWQYSKISWSRSLLINMLVLLDVNGIPVDSRYGWVNWSGSPDFSLYYPMKVRYTAIIVPPGGGEPVWP